MTARPDASTTTSTISAAPAQRSFARSLLKLARPTQWSKSVFVLIGPFYGMHDLMAAGGTPGRIVFQALVAAAAFALVSSACYIVNDIFDRENDRAHPRKKNRPIASGRVTIPQAITLALSLLAVATVLTLLLPMAAALKVGILLALYAGNVFLYSVMLKHHIMADVISLALGFVIRVLAGCFAVGIDEPSVWLMNVTFFISMFLAFGKRLGERRTLGIGTRAGQTELVSAAGPMEPGGPAVPQHHGAAAHRRVQARYTDTLLQIAVVVCAAITLMGYSLYVQDQATRFHLGYRMWLTVLPLTYGLFRCIVLLEEGAYDDPTEIAIRDRGMQLAVVLFGALTVAMMLMRK